MYNSGTAAFTTALWVCAITSGPFSAHRLGSFSDLGLQLRHSDLQFSVFVCLFSLDFVCVCVCVCSCICAGARARVCVRVRVCVCLSVRVRCFLFVVVLFLFCLFASSCCRSFVILILSTFFLSLSLLRSFAKD